MQATKTVFILNIKILYKKSLRKNKLSIEDIQPPKKKDTYIAEFTSIFVYSAKKNIAKFMAEYSTLYPATNSASASGKSKGTLFVSANNIIKK